MLIKISIPSEAKILQNNGHDIVFQMPPFRGQYQTAASIFSVPGQSLRDLEENDAITCSSVLANCNGRLETEDESDDLDGDSDD